MRQILAIALNDLRIIFRDRSIFLNIAIIPIALAFAIGLATGGTGGGPATLIVDIVDQDTGERSARFLASLTEANPNLVLCPLNNTEEDPCGLGDAMDGSAPDAETLDRRLREQTALAQLVIPPDFSARLDAGEDVTVIYRSNESLTAPSFILQAVQSATERVSGTIIASRVGGNVVDVLPWVSNADTAALVQSIGERAEQAWQQEPVQVRVVESAQAAQPASAASGFAQSIPGMASMYVMFAVLPAMAAFIHERKTWTLQRLIVMPVSRAQVLAGKLLARFTLGMIQIAIMFGFGLLLGLRFGNDPLALILVMVVYTLCVTALALALMTFIRTSAQAESAALFITITLAPLGGAWWSLDIVPDWMRIVGHISPIAWAMDAYHSLIFFGGNLGTVIVPVLVLLGAALVLFAVGVSRFRYE